MATVEQSQASVISPHEADRLKAVRRYGVLDSASDGALERIAALAATCMGTPMAAITIVDHDRIWCVARHGLQIRELEREPGLRAWAILQDEPYVVLDASVDQRCFNNSLVDELGLRFYAAAPIITHDGYRLGTINVMDTQPRQVSTKDLGILQDLAAIVLDELELRFAAHKLQEAQSQLCLLGEAFQLSALPSRLPRIPGLDLAAWFKPAGPELLVGGDFYDAIDLGRGSWGLIIGDVCGKGAAAAVVTAAVLNQVRALAEVDRYPRQLLWDLNESLINEGKMESLCTVCYMLLQPGPGYLDLTICCAGHPLPLVRRANGSIEAACEEGTLIGAFHEPHLRDSQIRLEAGDALLAYTDGIIEQHRDAQLGEANLRQALSGCLEWEAASILSHLEVRTQPSAKALDDRAMLLIRVIDQESTDGVEVGMS